MEAGGFNCSFFRLILILTFIVVKQLVLHYLYYLLCNQFDLMIWYVINAAGWTARRDWCSFAWIAGGWLPYNSFFYTYLKSEYTEVLPLCTLDRDNRRKEELTLLTTKPESKVHICDASLRQPHIYVTSRRRLLMHYFLLSFLSFLGKIGEYNNSSFVKIFYFNIFFI